MKRNNTTILLVLLLGLVAISQIGEFELGAEPPIYRPVWGSVGCELTGDESPSTTYALDNEGKRTVFCVGPECRVSDLNGATCQFWQSRLIAGEVGGDTATDEGQLYNLNGGQGEFFTVNARCFDPVQYTACNQIVNFIGGSLLSGYCWDISQPPATGTFNVRWKEIMLKKYQDGSPQTITVGSCYPSSIPQNIEGMQPIAGDKSKTDMWLTTGTKTILGETVYSYLFGTGGMQGNVQTDDEGEQYIPMGRYLPYLVEWRRLEGPNIHVHTPDEGDFAGKKILCDSATNRVYEIETVTTDSGSYQIPTKDLGSVECCITAGACYGEETCSTGDGSFECKEEAIRECLSDLECEDSIGSDSGGKYIMEGDCVNGNCQYDKRYVECHVSSDCPDKPDHIKECTANHECKYTYVPPVECTTGSDCDDGDSETIDECISGKCEYRYEDTTTTIPQNCETQCTVDMDIGGLIQHSFIDPLCFMTCTITQFISGIVRFTANVIKLVLVGAITILSIGLLNKKLVGRRRKGREVGMLLSVGLGLLIGYLLWILI